MKVNEFVMPVTTMPLSRPTCTGASKSAAAGATSALEYSVSGASAVPAALAMSAANHAVGTVTTRFRAMLARAFLSPWPARERMPVFRWEIPMKKSARPPPSV